LPGATTGRRSSFPPGAERKPGRGPLAGRASYNSLGKAHLALGELEEAERYFREALRLAEKLSDARLEAQSSSNLAEIHLARGRTEQAEELLRAASARLPAGDPGPEQAILLHNLGAVLKAQDRLPEALDFFRQALALNLRHERFEEAASNHYMIASVQSRQADAAAALASLGEALRFDRLMERSLGIAKDLAAMGLLYRRQGDEAAALDSYRRSLQVYQSLSLAEEARRLLPALIELAERAGFTGEAQTYRRLRRAKQAEPAGPEVAVPRIGAQAPPAPRRLALRPAAFCWACWPDRQPVFLVAFPLWYFSSRSRPVFTLVVGGLLAAGLLYLPVRGLRRAGRRAGGFGPLWRGRILPTLRTAALVPAGLAAAYGIALLAARTFR
jgi:tetratricopeptide (TPR) repeat protein